MNPDNLFLRFVFVLLLLPFFSKAQGVDKLLLEAKQQEAVFRDNEALSKYLEVLKLQPDHITALCKVSELYSLTGKRQATKEKQKEYYAAALKYAKQAYATNPTSADACFVMSVAMGRLAMMASGQEKIDAVKAIKSYAEKAVIYDPGNFKGYHVLGKWHYEVSDLNSLERWLVKVTYGALPDASLSKSIAYYEKSMQLNGAILINYLELAKAYHRNDEEKKAIATLEAMGRLPNSSGDDATIRAEAKKLLEKWKD